MQFRTSRALIAAAIGIAVLAAAGVTSAMAQIGPPPLTVYGSINDADGPVEAGVKVEAYVGDVECSDGKGRTGLTGEGDAEVTVYVVQVVDEAQRDGCGEPGAEITIKVGDKMSEQTVEWDPRGIVRLDLTWGDVAPVPIPTVTPVPEGQPAPNSSELTAEPPENQETAVAIETQGAAATTEAEETATQGGVSTGDQSSNGSSNGDGEDDGGMPVWAIVALVLGGVAVVGGGVGYLVARSNREDSEPF